MFKRTRHHPRMRVTHFPFPNRKLGRPDKPGDDDGWLEKERPVQKEHVMRTLDFR
jgi:hypothetical protein